MYQELGAFHELHHAAIDSKRRWWNVCPTLSPEVHNNLFCLVNIVLQIVIVASGWFTSFPYVASLLLLSREHVHSGATVTK